jgi:hypothetical protein
MPALSADDARLIATASGFAGNAIFNTVMNRITGAAASGNFQVFIPVPSGTSPITVSGVVTVLRSLEYDSLMIRNNRLAISWGAPQ